MPPPMASSYSPLMMACAAWKPCLLVRLAHRVVERPLPSVGPGDGIVQQVGRRVDVVTSIGRGGAVVVLGRERGDRGDKAHLKRFVEGSPGRSLAPLDGDGRGVGAGRLTTEQSALGLRRRIGGMGIARALAGADPHLAAINVERHRGRRGVARVANEPEQPRGRLGLVKVGNQGEALLRALPPGCAPTRPDPPPPAATRSARRRRCSPDRGPPGPRRRPERPHRRRCARPPHRASPR